MSFQIANSENKITLKKNNELLNSSQGTGTGIDQLDKAIETAGYAYDPIQDIFFSIMNPWQRGMGYCRLYDEASAPMGMIIDCEPIRFEYQGKKWMISFWKGQYDMVTGGEIGVYTASLDLNIPGIFSGTFYQSVSDDALLQMSFSLRKNGNTLFTRKGKHWWLTGFKLGEFSEPSELTMDIEITFDNWLMRDSFISGLKDAGYYNHEITILGNSVRIIFDVPHTRQPFTRTKETDWIIQRKNELLCKKFQEVTEDLETLEEKMRAIEEQAPELYNNILKIGKTNKFYELFTEITIIAVFILSLTLFGSKIK